jgi:hypothetical protein
MTLDELRQIELRLMRQAFELACSRAGLSTSPDQITPDHAQLARVVQSLVEQGHTDARAIAELARNAMESDDGVN